MILQGDALEELRKLPDKCCSVCVTSPPYYNARDYGAADQLGTESSPEEYTRKLVEAVNRLHEPPGVMISASAVGYYGSSGGCHGELDLSLIHISEPTRRS